MQMSTAQWVLLETSAQKAVSGLADVLARLEMMTHSDRVAFANLVTLWANETEFEEIKGVHGSIEELLSQHIARADETGV